jgi:glycosyltransferase involved in cell wall biosynthesis
MRILFLSHYFPPEVNAPASRTYDHCRQWVADGHEVTVVTCVPNHPAGQIYPGYSNRLYQVETKDGIKVVRLLTYITPNEGFFKRSASYLFYMVMAIAAAPFLPRADVVVSTSPQFFNGLAGYFVGILKRSPWVLEIRDLWPESILAVGAVKNRFLIRMLEGIERFAYRRADKIVAVTDSFVRHITNCGADLQKIEVVKNGVDLSLFSAVPYDQDFAAELGLGGKFVAAYVGTHGAAHGLDTILDAALLLQNRSDIVFLMVGDGAEKLHLVQRCAELKLANVVMLDQQSKEKMPAIWGVSDVGLVHLRRLDLFKSVIPSKIFENMAMQKPIILGAEGESKEIIEQADAGICIEPSNPRQLADAIVNLSEHRELSTRLGGNGAEFVAANYDRKVLARRLLGILLDVGRGK